MVARREIELCMFVCQRECWGGLDEGKVSYKGKQSAMRICWRREMSCAEILL